MSNLNGVIQRFKSFGVVLAFILMSIYDGDGLDAETANPLGGGNRLI